MSVQAPAEKSFRRPKVKPGRYRKYDRDAVRDMFLVRKMTIAQVAREPLRIGYGEPRLLPCQDLPGHA